MSTRLRTSSFLVVGLGLVASSAFAGCGGDEGSSSGNTTTTSNGGGGTTSTTGNSGGGGSTTTASSGGGGSTSTGGGGSGGTSSGGGGSGGSTSSGGGGSTSTSEGGGGTTTTGEGGSGGTTTTSTTTSGSGGGGGVAPGDYDCSPPVGNLPNLKRTTIAQGLDKPVYVRAAPGDKERLYVLEQTGKIRIIKNGALLAEPFLDITDRVHPAGFGDERGLIGLAFHPDYQQNGRFFVYYTEEVGNPGDQVVAEYSRSNNPDLATKQANGFGQEVQVLFKIDDAQSNHNGGMLDFSHTDGFLYIGTGDGGGADDGIFDNQNPHGPFGHAQDLASMWGKILRIDVNNKDAGKNYAIPPGNIAAIPTNNPSASFLPEIWDFGLRNPWRFSFDPCNGDLFIGDVGQYTWEEVDIEAAGTGHKNYGWVYYEGNMHDKYPNLMGNMAGAKQTLTWPVDEYSHAGGNCSITGGFVYRSAAIPALRGRYFYGDYCSGRIWSFRWNGTTIEDKIDHTADLGTASELSSFGYDNDGNVYLTRVGGQVQRIDVE